MTTNSFDQDSKLDAPTAARRTSITPGQPWLDTNGNLIQAHGGSILYDAGTFYWYGENKEHTTGHTDTWHWGVRCYASQDLYNWEDRGVIIPPVLDDPTSPLHPSQKMDRPHIIHNRFTGQYVCWIKVMYPDDTQKSSVLVADSLLGPYRVVRSHLRPLGMSAGDFDLVVDPVDGKGYYIFERVHSELIIADLTDDYTNVTGYYSTHFPHPHPPFVREAPAYFRRGSLHYLFTSGTSGYFPNASEVAVAKTYHGPWTVLGDPHPNDETRTSYRSQICSVFKHPHKKDLFIALADRWLGDRDVDARKAAMMFETAFASGRPADFFRQYEQEDPEVFAAPDTSRAGYVWLPVRFDGDMAYLDWQDEWRIEDYE
ncbi:family 43 glycosylhydrolase [Deinococcus yavapaiensis]|uniref:Glycosyl hydrolase family 43 n=1 Tax=Deinococcus yavapaiensis KR-236 TaxID=694435 RepID=A0A318S3I0_9DEIO|nr:family 43 glycosylhydrolase [Deinococcus yavapaiensis]PYE51007.1 glycosyl hydrolase family 43 [Deinococcus yavapaiensis KR-236]